MIQLFSAIEEQNLQRPDRKLSSRSGLTLGDDIGNKDALINGVTSAFNGVEGSVDLGYQAIPVGDFSIEFNFTVFNSSFTNVLLSQYATGDPGRFTVVAYTLGRVRVQIGSIAVSSSRNFYTLEENGKCCIEYNYALKKFTFYKNGVYDTEVINLAFADIMSTNTVVGAASFGTLSGCISDVNINNSLFVPLPHLGYGFDVNGDAVNLTIFGDVTECYTSGGSLHLIEKGFINRNGEIIPNNNEGLPITSILDGDVLVQGTTFINDSNFMITLFTSGQTDIEYSFFDKSNALIWKQDVRDSIYYDEPNSGVWHSSEFTQAFIEANIQNVFKYKFWIKLVNNQYRDLFLYNNALEGDEINKALKYVS